MKYKKFIHVFPFSLLRCSCFWQLRYKWLFLVVVCLSVVAWIRLEECKNYTPGLIDYILLL